MTPRRPLSLEAISVSLAADLRLIYLVDPPSLEPLSSSSIYQRIRKKRRELTIRMRRIIRTNGTEEDESIDKRQWRHRTNKQHEF